MAGLRGEDEHPAHDAHQENGERDMSAFGKDGRAAAGAAPGHSIVVRKRCSEHADRHGDEAGRWRCVLPVSCASSC